MSDAGARHERRVVVVGAGITGLAAARALLTETHAPRVAVLESDTRLGGKIRTSPFAGLPAVDEGADAYLTRFLSSWKCTAFTTTPVSDGLV